MKEKWYFCDWLDDTNMLKIDSILCPLICVFVIIISFIFGSIYYNKEKFNYNEDLNSYSEDDYKYLDNIINNSIEKDRINTAVIPDNVEYEIIKKDNQIKYNLFLNSNKDKSYGNSATIRVTLSKDYKILDKVPNYSSKEDYTKKIKISFYISIIFLSIVTACMILLVILLLFIIALLTSMLHKNIDMNKNKEKSNK